MFSGFNITCTIIMCGFNLYSLIFITECQFNQVKSNPSYLIWLDVHISPSMVFFFYFSSCSFFCKNTQQNNSYYTKYIYRYIFTLYFFYTSLSHSCIETTLIHKMQWYQYHSTYRNIYNKYTISFSIGKTEQFSMALYKHSVQIAFPHVKRVIVKNEYIIVQLEVFLMICE